MPCSRFGISPVNLRQDSLFKPVAAALALMVMLPPLAPLGGTASSHGPFSVSAQTSGCTPSPNQIIQDCTFLSRAQFEQTAVLGYLAQHGLPSTDAALVYQYGASNLRNTLR